MSIDEALFDIRVVERNIARGKVTREQYEAYLANLPDDEDNGAPTETPFIHKITEEGDEADKKDPSKRRR